MDYLRKSRVSGERTPLTLRQKIKIENLIRKIESLKQADLIHRKLFQIVVLIYLLTVVFTGVVVVSQ